MTKKQLEKFFNMKLSADGKSADIFIYGEITKWAWEEFGEVSSTTFKAELDDLGDGVETIHLFINSPGGSVFETMAIIAMLQRHPARIISHIDGIAASCASVLPMVSDEIRMPANALMMIHHAWTYASGNAAELRKAADDIERISQSMCRYYLDRAGDKLDVDTLNKMLEQDTWLTAEQAFEMGLCDVVEQTNQAVAYSFEEKFAKQYKNIPQQLIEPQVSSTSTPQQMSVEEKALREKIIADSKANLTYLNTIL